jgi:DNA-binding GntR family transcriptional regulator
MTIMGSTSPLARRAIARTTSVVKDDEHFASRSELVYQKLRDGIQQGALKPGQRVMEVEVAERLAVSRTPVRDALRRLESEGMLTHEPRVGLVVASLNRQAVSELYVMREVLEGTAARLCARHASDMEVMELEELVKHEQRLQGTFEELARHNRRFHEAIHRGAHNRYLEKSLSAVNDSMWLLGKSQMLLPHRAKTALTEHAALLAAIRKRDPDAAEQAARRHVRAAHSERLKLLFPESGK